MTDALYLAGRYLRFHWVKTLILTLSIALIIFIPLGLNLLTKKGADQLTSRARATPLLIGTQGSKTELVLSALYFKEPNFAPISYSEVDQVRTEGLSRPIPLHLRFNVEKHPVIGTSSDYFNFRDLVFQEGRAMALLGECVLGAKAAKELQVHIGQSVISSPVTAFDIAGSFPLKMTVVGILRYSGTPDDNAVITDIKTTWVISGLAHGHQDVTRTTPDSLLMSRDSSSAVASPAILAFTEITPDNRSSFHFHGDPSTYPVDAIIAIPEDRRSSLLMRGRYENKDAPVQIIQPLDVILDLVGTMFRVRDLIFLAAVSIGVATLLIVALVFALSIRLRQREINTIYKIGGSVTRVRQILGTEIVAVAFLGLLIALLLTLATSRIGLQLVEQFIL